MKKELKDYLPFYPQVPVRFKDEVQKENDYGEIKSAFITGLFLNPAGAGLMAQLSCIDYNGNGWEDPLDVMVDEIEPILRPLSDMTEGEQKDCNNITGYGYEFAAKRTQYLLLKHFDLFELIKYKLAIDATTLKETNPST